jgi:hypothetical protein
MSRHPFIPRRRPVTARPPAAILSAMARLKRTPHPRGADLERIEEACHRLRLAVEEMPEPDAPA